MSTIASSRLSNTTTPQAESSSPCEIANDAGGLIQELLCAYEHLHSVIEITTQTASTAGPAEVQTLICRRLEEALGADQVWCVEDPSGQRADSTIVQSGPKGDPGQVKSEDIIQHLAAQVRREGRTCFRCNSLSEQDLLAEHMGMMAGLLHAQEAAVPIVVCVDRGNRGFSSADVLLFEEILSFGGLILRNLHLVERNKRVCFEIVRALVNAIEKKDPYTCGHSKRVGILCRLIGEQMGLAPNLLQELEWAGMLHDVGKIGIPEAILTKPGKLTPGEFELVQQHAQMSCEVLKPVSSLDSVIRVVAQHHEDFDGGGYPNGLRGKEICLFARILRVADVFDSMVSNRSYRRAHTVEQASEFIMKNACNKFDPFVVGVFRQLLESGTSLEWRDLLNVYTTESEDGTS